MEASTYYQHYRKEVCDGLAVRHFLPHIGQVDLPSALVAGCPARCPLTVNGRPCGGILSHPGMPMCNGCAISVDPKEEEPTLLREAELAIAGGELRDKRLFRFVSQKFNKRDRSPGSAVSDWEATERESWM